MSYVGEMRYLTIGSDTYSLPADEIFVAEYDTTSYADIGAAVTADKTIFVYYQYAETDYYARLVKITSLPDREYDTIFTYTFIAENVYDDGYLKITCTLNNNNGNTVWSNVFNSVQTPILDIAVTLSSSGWSNNSQTAVASGVTSSNTVIVSPDSSDIDDYVSAGIKCTAQGSDTLTFTCDTTPSVSIGVNVVIIN